MTLLGIQEIAKVLGRDIDAQAAASILGMDATEEELTEALSRFVRGEAIGTDVMTAAGSRIDRLCEILSAAGIAREDEDGNAR